MRAGFRKPALKINTGNIYNHSATFDLAKHFIEDVF